MRTYCIAQGTLLRALWCPKMGMKRSESQLVMLDFLLPHGL